VTWQKKSQFILVVFGILPIMLLATVGCGDAKPVADTETATKTATGNESQETAARSVSDGLNRSLTFPVAVFNDANVTLRGRVVDEEGNPVAGALVRRPGRKLASLREQFDVETDANGVFQFELDSRHLDDLVYFYAMTLDQPRWGYGWFEPKEGETIIPEIEITIEPGTFITGTVVDEDGKPVEGATVAGGITLVPTDAEGTFKFAYKHYRPSTVYAYKEGIGFDYLDVKDIYKQLGRELWEDFDDWTVQLTLAPTTPVTIKVVNKEGEPLPGVIVAPSEILEEGTTPHYMTMLESFMDRFNATDFCCVKTNEEGIATLNFLPERFIARTRFSAYCPKEGVLHPDGRRVYYYPAYRWMRGLPEGQNFLEITLGKLARVKGTVKLADGTPVPWISINVNDLRPTPFDMPGHRSGFTDINGAYDLLIPPNDVYHFEVADNMLGIAPRVLNFKIGDGNTDTTLDFVLEKGIRLHGTVYDAEGKPVVGEYNSRRYSDYNVVIVEKKPKPEPDPFESPFLDNEDESDIWNAWIWDKSRNSYWVAVVDGKYECLLPAAKGEYNIRAGGGGYGSGVGNGLPREFSLNGDEEVYELDLYMTEKGRYGDNGGGLGDNDLFEIEGTGGGNLER